MQEMSPNGSTWREERAIDLICLRALKDGWLDGEGLAPPSYGLDWFDAAFARFYPADAPRPYVYPMPDGGVQLEW